MLAQSPFVIDDLAELVHSRNGHQRQVFVVIDAYLDESGIHEGAQICVISGYFGDRGRFRRLERRWEPTLKRYGLSLSDFHAKDAVKQTRLKPLMEDLAMIIASCEIYPVSFGIVVDEFKSYTLLQRRFLTGATLNEKTGKLITSGCPNKPYFVPFQDCIRRIADYTPADTLAHYIIGVDRPFYEYATSMFAGMVRRASIVESHSTWKTKDRLGSLNALLASKTPELQAADLHAHLTYLHMLERHKEGNWNVMPSEPLLTCIKNRLSPNAHYS